MPTVDRKQSTSDDSQTFDCLQPDGSQNQAVASTLCVSNGDNEIMETTIKSERGSFVDVVAYLPKSASDRMNGLLPVEIALIQEGGITPSHSSFSSFVQPGIGGVGEGSSGDTEGAETLKGRDSNTQHGEKHRGRFSSKRGRDEFDSEYYLDDSSFKDGEDDIDKVVF